MLKGCIFGMVWCVDTIPKELFIDLFVTHVDQDAFVHSCLDFAEMGYYWNLRFCTACHDWSLKLVDFFFFFFFGGWWGWFC